MRTNETRDRLRKKLSLLVSAKISTMTVTTSPTKQAVAVPVVETTIPATTTNEAVTQQPPTLKAAAAAAAQIPGITALPRLVSREVIENKAIKQLTPTVEDQDDKYKAMAIKKIVKELTTNSNNVNAKATVSKEIANLCDHFSELSTANENSSDELKKKVLQEQIMKLQQENNFLRMSNGCGTVGGACDCHLRGESRAYSSSPEVYERKLKLKNQQEPVVAPQKPTENPEQVNKWIHETLNFIEGADKFHPRTADPKKVAKKAKQKQRKEEGKRIAELIDLRQQFHDIYYKEHTDKDQLKILKAEKTRDKRTIQELEVNVKKLHTAKAKIEQSILELIATVKQTNAEFKFAYLPTREQLLEKLKENMKVPATVAATKEYENVKVKLVNPAFVAAGMPLDHAFDYPTNTGQFVYNHPPQPHTIYAPISATFEKAATTMSANQEEMLTHDNNRIVTIRRINVPNVPDPQVTVTAKGITPDKDKLLYTFVNGHLIQSEVAAQQQYANAAPPAPAVALTKKQMKKEAQRLAKQVAAYELQKQKEEEAAKLLQEEALAAAQKALLINNKSNKNKTKKDHKKNDPISIVSASSGNISPSTVNVTRDNSVSSMNLKQQNKQLQPQQQNNKKNNKKLNQQQQKQEKVKEQKEIKINMKKEKMKEKKPKVVDNGQFDNNPYKTLNAGESEYESSESENEQMDIKEDINEIVEICNKHGGADKNKKKTGNNAENEHESDKQKSKKTINNKKQQKQAVNVVVAEDKKTKKDNAKNNAQSINNKKTTTTTTLTRTTTTTNKNKIDETTNRIKNNKKQQVVVVADERNSNKGRKTKVVEQQKQQQQQQTNEKNKDKRYIQQQQQQQQMQLQQQQQQLYQQQQQQQQNYNILSQQMQQLRLNTNYSGYETTMGAYAPTNNAGGQTMNSKYSIMDQLSRGVQVENLSLPPGITLTKVDPVKSEQLRQKSESIKNISKPLATQQSQQNIPMAWNHPGATIIAPPAATYMNSAYTPTAIDNATGIIMLDSANGLEGTPKQVKQNLKILDQSNALDGVGRKKARRRRNKAKSSTPTTSSDSKEKAPQMITLRNPMFQPNPNLPTNDVNVQQQPSAGAFIGGRSMLGLPIPQALPVDQPAAIIKNENGMFTIRNPALHQAVTNGLAMSGYRGYNNVSYYTPQEAVAESARNAQAQKKMNEEAGTFSYFSEKSDEKINTKSDLHNNISISCSTMEANKEQATVENTEIQNKQKCISAIGSERESAQLKQRILERNKTPENTWAAPGYLSGTTSGSNFYNGFNGYSEKSGLFADLPRSQDCAHMHHSCGDDSPPPKITGFTSSYLDGIPNTGVIRYDDASFLKNLISNNNLNNEVSIHNISKSGYNRTNPAYMTPQVDITPIYARSSSASMLRQSYNQTDDQHSLLDGSQEQRQFMDNNTSDYGSYNIDGPSPYDTTTTTASEFGLSGLWSSSKTAKSIDSTSPDRRRSPPFVFEANARNANKKPLPTNSWW